MNLFFRFISSAFVALLLSSLCLHAQSQIITPSRPVASSGAEALIDIIKSAQRRHVRDSWGERASECFTDRDLDKFHDSKIPTKVADDLRTDKRFQSTIQAIRSLPPQQRDELLDRAASSYKPTWAQLGRIDRAGQTEAGQQAEKEIAAGIVAFVKEQL